MPRKKVKLAWIANDSARRSSFRRRKMGLLKKVSELSTLCAVDACVIIYEPGNSLPDVWPSPLEAHYVLNRFKSMPEMDQSMKMFNQEAILTEQIAKLNEQLMRQLKENRECQISQLMYESFLGKELHDVTAEELCDMAWVVGNKMKEIQERIEELKKAMSEIPPNMISRNGGVSSNETTNIMEVYPSYMENP